MVQKLSPLADYFINDAFAAAHRSQPSLVGFAFMLPSAAGRIMERELKALYNAMNNVQRPCVYILGGVKVDDSIMVMENVLRKWKCRLYLDHRLGCQYIFMGLWDKYREVQ